MPTQITQVEDTDRQKTILHVEGEMLLDDALLLEKIALEMRDLLGRDITLDLADLDLLDSESAPILKRMQREQNFEIEGLGFFLQKVVEETEKTEKTDGTNAR